MSEDDFLPPSATTPALSLSKSTSAGLAGLFIGCTLLVSACVLLVFNVILFSRGMRGIPEELARIGGLIGVLGVVLLGALSVLLWLRSWSTARRGESRALGIAATAASAAGLAAWLIAGIDLLMILFD
jgi:hypothetical protein